MLIVADTSPLNYLVLIDSVYILPTLYGRILAPPEVLRELEDAAGPQIVRAWASSPPQWLEVRKAHAVDLTLPLDAGERASIALAQELAADRLLIDERDGRRVAVRLGIAVAGTLAVLRDAALAGLLDLEPALDRLRQTTFRASPGLIAQILADVRKNRKLDDA